MSRFHQLPKNIGQEPTAVLTPDHVLCPRIGAPTSTQADERRIDEVHARLIGTVDTPDSTGKKPASGGGGGAGGSDGTGGGDWGSHKEEGVVSNSADRSSSASSSPATGSTAR